MKWRFVMLAFIALAGCTLVQMPGPVPSTLRDPAAPVASQADVVAADLHGDWVVRQLAGNAWPAFDRPVTIPVTIPVTFIADGTRVVVPPVGVTCDAIGLCHGSDQPVTYVPDEPGRWRAKGFGWARAGVPSEIWVHWMDFDDRTLAIGNPNGNFVAILDRAATGGDDRITAAREILDWYGYDLNRLQSN